MLPLHDDNPTSRLAILTYLLIALNVAIFGWQATKSDADQFRSIPEFRNSQAGFVCHWGVIPARLSGAEDARNSQDPCVRENERTPGVLTLITHQFIHGGLWHLLGNMLFLFIFGNNVEDRFGRRLFLPFYLACGLAAAFGEILLHPTSLSVLIGASGAISGVLGAYLVFFPRARVLAVVGLIPLRVPAWMVLVAYLAFQLLYVVQESGVDGRGGVAFWAHIIGFTTGALLALPFRQRGPRPRRPIRGGAS